MPTGQSRCWRWARTVQPTPCLRKTRVTRSWPSPRHMETPLPCRGRNSLPSTAAHLPLPLWLSRACLPPMKCGPPQCHGNIPILLCLPCHACVCVCLSCMSVYTCIFVWTTSAVKHDDILFCKSSLKVKEHWSEVKEHDGPYSQEWNENNKTETYSCFSDNLDGLVTKKEKRLKVTKQFWALPFCVCTFFDTLRNKVWRSHEHGHTNCHFASILSTVLWERKSLKVVKTWLWALWFCLCVCTVCRALRERKKSEGCGNVAMSTAILCLYSLQCLEQSFKVWKTWLCEHCHFVSGPSMVPSTRLVCVVEMYIIFVSSTLSRCFVYLVGYFSSSHKVTQNIIVPCQHRFCGPSLSCWLFAWLKVWPGLTVCVHLGSATTHLAMSDAVTISQWPENGLHVNLTKFYKKGLHWVPCVFILCR